MKESPDHLISINKFISSTGYCSRREADQIIAEGRVTINGAIAKAGNRVSDDDEIIVDGSYLRRKKKRKIYIAYNKPIGIVCTTDPSERDNIVSQINHKERLFPIGRLDKPSQGLIFLTNDGDIVNKILRAGNNHEKEYIVGVNKAITTDFIRKMGNGIPILGTVTKKCKVEKINDFTFKIILTQGLNRQIRRMCEYLDYKVTRLKRTRIMNVSLGDLPIGKWRELSTSEFSELDERSSNSIKTEDASIKIKGKKFYPGNKKRKSHARKAIKPKSVRKK